MRLRHISGDMRFSFEFLKSVWNPNDVKGIFWRSASDQKMFMLYLSINSNLTFLLFSKNLLFENNIVLKLIIFYDHSCIRHSEFDLSELFLNNNENLVFVELVTFCYAIEIHSIPENHEFNSCRSEILFRNILHIFLPRIFLL